MPWCADSSRTLQRDRLGSLPMQKHLRTNPHPTAGFSCVGFNSLFNEGLNPTVGLNPSIGLNEGLKPAVELNPNDGFK